jgi:hypothetical protein
VPPLRVAWRRKTARFRTCAWTRAMVGLAATSCSCDVSRPARRAAVDICPSILKTGHGNTRHSGAAGVNPRASARAGSPRRRAALPTTRHRAPTHHRPGSRPDRGGRRGRLGTSNPSLICIVSRLRTAAGTVSHLHAEQVCVTGTTGRLETGPSPPTCGGSKTTTQDSTLGQAPSELPGVVEVFWPVAVRMVATCAEPIRSVRQVSSA